MTAGSRTESQSLLSLKQADVVHARRAADRTDETQIMSETYSTGEFSCGSEWAIDGANGTAAVGGGRVDIDRIRRMMRKS